MADEPIVVEIATEEGFRNQPYKDSRGLWTIGEGRCLETSPLTGAEWKFLLDAGLISAMITQLGARHLTEERVAALRLALQHFPTYTNAPAAVQDILVDMSFQMGVGKVMTFTTFTGLIDQKKFAAAAADGRTTLWYRQTPNRAEVLMKRLENVNV